MNELASAQEQFHVRSRADRSRRALAWSGRVLFLVCAWWLSSCASTTGPAPRLVSSRSQWQPVRFKVFFSNRFGTIQSIELRGDKLISVVQGSSFGTGMYGPIERERRVHPLPADWQALKTAFDRADIWAWQGTYRNADFQGGPAWSLEIVYPDRRVVTAGYGTYPSDKTPLKSVDFESRRFQIVEQAIERLLARPLFH